MSEGWGSQPANRHYFQNISLVEKQWELFSQEHCFPLCVAAASPAKSYFMLLWDLLNYCQADLQSHLPGNYLIDSFDAWFHLHHSKNSLNRRCKHGLHLICKTCGTLCLCGCMSKSVWDSILTACAQWHLALYELHLDICLKHYHPWFSKISIFTSFKNQKWVVFKLWELWNPKSSFMHVLQLCARTATVSRN